MRPWQHVLEPLAGYLMLGHKLSESPVLYSTAYNFGPYIEDTLTVQDLVELAIKKWGAGSYEHMKLTNAPHEAGLLKLDINKAVNELGWTPKLNAEKAIEYSIDWYKSFHQNQTSIAEFTEKQILDYLNL